MSVGETFKTPIRAVSVQPFVRAESSTSYVLYLIYEEANGTARGQAFDINTSTVTFSDASPDNQFLREEGCIVWRTVEEKAGFFGGKPTIKRELVEIRLRRDWQIKS